MIGINDNVFRTRNDGVSSERAREEVERNHLVRVGMIGRWAKLDITSEKPRTRALEFRNDAQAV